MTYAESFALALDAVTPAKTMTQWIGRDVNGYALAVVMPYGDGFCVSGHHFGGTPYTYESVERAQSVAKLLHHLIAEWQQVKVPQ